MVGKSMAALAALRIEIGSGPGVFHHRRPGDDIAVREDAVEQMDLRSGEGILHGHIQGLHALLRGGVDGGKPRQGVLSLADGVAFVPDQGRRAAVFPLNGKGGHPVIPRAVGRVLQGEVVKAKAACIGGAGAEGVPAAGGKQVGKVGVGDFGSVIKVQKESVGVHAEHIAGGPGVQTEGLGLGIEQNGHSRHPFS